MSLQDWGALGELIGGVAIIVSLLYVGLQVKQSTDASRAATNQSFSAQFSELILHITKPELRDIFWRGINGLKNLKEGEIASFMALMAAIMRTYETFYFERVEGRFNSRMWEGYKNQVIDLYNNDGVREYWAVRKHQYSDEFSSFLEKESSLVEAKPMYTVDS
jgi:hypothetical protein